MSLSSSRALFSAPSPTALPPVLHCWGIWAFSVLLAVILCAPEARGEVELIIHPTEVNFFQAEGASFPELLDWLNANGPSDKKGRPRHALTRWKLDWELLDGRPRVELWTEVLVPSRKLEGLQPSDRSRWQRYFSALVEHESIHLDHALRGAKDLQARLKELLERDLKSEGLSRASNLEGRKLANQIRRWDLQLDLQTLESFGELRGH